MLSLHMKSGEYLTIGGNVVVQVFKESGPQFRVSVKAPREISIVRGTVSERGGEERPDGLLARGPKKSRADQIHNAQRLQKRAERQEAAAAAVDEMQRILDAWDAWPEDGQIQALRAQLARLRACTPPSN